MPNFVGKVASFAFCPGGGGTRMARGGIRLVHGHTKSTLITYFSGMKIDPNYAFLKAFFLICPSCPFQNMYIWPKTHPFFPILHVFAPLNAVRAYSAWSWKTTLITWIFGRAWYPPWHSSGPPPGAFWYIWFKKYHFFSVFNGWRPYLIWGSRSSQNIMTSSPNQT